MTLPKPIIISVPGTSANLGPGFDILGMALKIYNHFAFRFDSPNYKATYRNGDKLPFGEEEDLVLSSYKDYFRIFLPHREFPLYQCKMELSLPMKGGLGSSASAVVAGFVLGREVHRAIFLEESLPSEGRFLYELAMQEGHPDNTSPAYLGGFVLSYFDREGHLTYFKKKFPNSVAIYSFIPKVEVSTSESRKALPTSYSMDDMIFNMTRTATWIQFFDTRKFSDLCIALEDRVHTPYRLPSIPGLESILPILQKKQLGYCLSGSGPTLLIFMERKKVSSLEKMLLQELDEVMKSIEVEYECRRIQTDNIGVRIKKW
jgi:homoserine kinase